MGRNTKSPKTINALMKHLRDDRQMEIGGSAQKTKLLRMGYFHGYKGYRYIRKPSNRIAYKTFDDLYAVYMFDNKLKALLYPYIMMIETALKNYVLDTIFEDKTIKSAKIEEIFNKVLTAYRNKKNTKKKEIIKTKLRVKNKIYKALEDSYSRDNNITKYFIDEEKNIPIWAVFELITFGVFGDFVACMDEKYRESLSKKLLIKQEFDTKHELIQDMISLLKGLRDSIAHNSIIFDVRFNKKNKGNRENIIEILKYNYSIKNVDFEYILDYVLLIIFILKLIKISKTERKQLFEKFESLVKSLKIDSNIYDQIVPNYFAKISNLLKKNI